MSLFAVFLVLVSAVLHVGWNFLLKSSARPKVFFLTAGSVTVVAAVILSLGAPLGLVPARTWLCVVLSAMIHAVYFLALSKAYESGDISYVYPICRAAPAFVPLAAFLLLGERISLRGGCGIALVVISMFVLQFRGALVQELRGMKAFLRRKDSLWAFITLATVVAYSIVDKAGMTALADVKDFPAIAQAPTYFMLSFTLSFIIYGAFLIPRTAAAYLAVWRGEWLKSLLAGLGMISSYCLILHVMKTEPLSYIVTLRQISVLIAVLCGWVLLKEKHGLLRLIAAAVMLAGIFLVATSR